MPDATYVLDRIEDDAWAVLESEGTAPGLSLPREWLPSAASEGDVIRVEIEEDGVVRFRLSPDETESRRQRARALREQVPRGPSGDLEL